MSVEVDRLLVALEARVGPYMKGIADAQRDTNKKLDLIEKKFASTERNVRASVGSMGAVLGTLGAYLSVEQVIGYANAWTRVVRSIEAGGDVFGINLASAQELTALANEARIDVEAYTKTYIRTAAAIRDYGMNASVAAEVTSTLAKALKLGSASASEQASTILQFSQALQKGKLDGDEFRTVMENAGVIQELLAKRLGVTKGRIVEMAAAGKLQLLDLVGAMRDGKEMIDAIFNMQPTTIDEGFTVLNNSITEFVGHLDQTYEISKSVANAMAFLAQNIDTIGKAALVAGVGLLSMYSPAVLAGIRGLGLAAASAAGPLGLLLGAVGAGATAFELFGDRIKTSDDGFVSLKNVVSAFTTELGESIRKMEEVADTAEDMAARMEAARRRGFAATIVESFNQSVVGPVKAVAGMDSGFAGRVRERANREAQIEALSNKNFAGNFGGYLSGRVREHKRETPTDKEAEKRMKRFEREIAQANRQIEAVEAEGRAVGKNAFEVARLRKEQELLTAARENDIALTPKVLADIDQTAIRFAHAVTEAETLRNAYEEMSSESKEFLSTYLKGIKDGESATDLLADSLDTVADKLIDMAVQNLVESALGGLSGRGGNAPGSSAGSALMSLFGFANGGIAANGRPVPLPRFAKGGVSRSAAIFGEAGPEAAVPLPDGRRIPVDLRMPSIPAATVAPAAPNVTISAVFNVSNGTPEGVDKLKTEIVPLVKALANKAIDEKFSRSDAYQKMRNG